MSYTVGTTVKVSCTFAVASTLTDPTSVTLKVKDPGANTDTYTYAGGSVTKASTGSYYKSIVPDEAGVWHFQWIGTGAAAGLREGSFEVFTAEVP